MIIVNLSEPIIKELRDKGMSAQRAAQLLGVGPRQAIHLLRKSGAKQTGCSLNLWRLCR